MGTNLIRAMLLASASATIAGAAAPAAAYAQEATYQIDIPAQPMGDALRALGKATKKNILFDGSIVRGKRSVAVRGRMSASDALARMVAGSGLVVSKNSRGLVVQGGNGDTRPARIDEGQSHSGFVDVPAAPPSAVVDARTGAALKGALVEIIETGEKTSTGDLGEFRFPGKNGTFNLRISYLGYPQYEQFVDLKDGRATSGILLSDGSAVGEIVVTAYQSSRAQALNQERTAENVSTVISDDLSGKFDGTTISDGLRRAPGVTFTVDPATGDGTNVIVRGMAPGYNTVTLNGLRLPVGDGINRSPTLSNILADSVSKITINKTLLPNQDGSGTGGLVEIETKGPLDRPDRYFNVAYERGVSARNFLDDESVSGTASMRFGASKNFGLSVSAQYRKRNLRRFLIGTGVNFGPYLPASQDGRPVTSSGGLDPRIPFPFEDGATDYYQNLLETRIADTSVRNLALGASLQWSIGDHTDLRLDYNRNTSSTDDLQQGMRLSFNTTYAQLPVDDLGGEIRPSLVWENASQPGLFANVSQFYGLVENKQDNSTAISFQGKSAFDNWEFEYRGGYAGGEFLEPRANLQIRPPSFGRMQFTRAQLTPEILANTTAGRIISAFPKFSGSSILLPGLNEAGYENLNGIGGYAFASSTSQLNRGSNDRKTAAVDVKRKFSEGILQYLQVGAFYEASTTKYDPGISYFDYTTSSTLSALGLNFDDETLAPIGQSPNLRLIQAESVRDYFHSIKSNSNSLVTATSSEPMFDPALDNTEEHDLAGYVQAALKIGRLQIVGGGRFERINVRATNTYYPLIIDSNGSPDLDYIQENSEFRTLTGVSNDFLPRLTGNYRFNDNLVLRFGYYKSIARPNLSDLNSGSAFSLILLPFYGPQFNQPLLQIFKGNPNLKSATTHNLDVSMEWYSDDIGVVKLGAFYKPTKNSFSGTVGRTINEVPDGVVLPSDPRFQTPNLFIQFSMPENSPDLDKLWGIEVALERQLKFLPGVLSGLGVYANYTYTKSSRTQAVGLPFPPYGVVYMKGVSYDSQSPHSGTAALTYSKGGLNSALSYTYQSGHYTGFPAYGLQRGRAAIDTLDFKLDYTFKLFGGSAKVVFEGSNLLKGPTDPTFANSIRNRNTGQVIPQEDSYLGGRTFRIGVSSTF